MKETAEVKVVMAFIDWRRDETSRPDPTRQADRAGSTAGEVAESRLSSEEAGGCWWRTRGESSLLVVLIHDTHFATELKQMSGFEHTMVEQVVSGVSQQLSMIPPIN